MIERLAKADLNPRSAHNALKVLQAKARLLTRFGRIAIWDIDIASSILTTSPELNKLLGFAEYATPSLEEIRSRYFPGEQARLQAVAQAAMLQDEKVFEADFRYLKPDGQLRWLNLHAEIVLGDAGIPVRILGTLTDLTERKAIEAALSQSQERLRDITDALPILISYVDADQRFQFVNKPYEAWFGLPREKILGRPLSEIMSPAVYEARRPYVERALRGETLKYDMDMPREGGVTNTEIMHLPHRDESGNVLGMYAVVQDITARKQSEEALRASEKRFRQFADQNPAIIWSGDENGRLTYLSNRWYAYTGDDPSEPMPLSWDHVVHPGDQMNVHERWAEAKAEGGVYDVEARLRRHDGQYRWHSFRAEPLRDENGRINGWLGTNSDNHEAVERRNEQQRAHDRLWRLSQELMIVRDMQGVIVSANPSATRILGWAPEDMIGKSIYDFIHPDDIMASKATVTAQLSGSEVISVQNRYRSKDGSYRLFDWRGAASEGYVHAVGRDITAERQTAEELRLVEESLRQAQKMEAVGQLTGGIAHDFNNMLAGIVGSLDVLQRRLNSKRYEDTQRFIEAAITSANRAAGLTQRLLAFGRRQSLDVKALDVGPLVLSLEDLVRRTIGANVGLAIRLEPDLWRAKADANQLESAILNLVINARDAMSEGGTLTIEAENRTVGRAAGPKAKDLTRGDYVVLSVTDNGEGMAPEVLDRAFEPFFTTKPIGQGTGLGLSMIFGLMRQIGGFTRIQSEVGIGTKVELYLPRAPAEELEEHVPEPRTAPRGDGETVLVVEDDEAVRMLVLTVLQDLGYSALQVADAEAALPILESGQRIDLLVSDVGLPGMNGRQLAELARKRRPDLRVLFMSGYAKGAGIRSGFLEAGMEMMTKPFNVDELGTAISNMLTGRA